MVTLPLSGWLKYKEENVDCVLQYLGDLRLTATQRSSLVMTCHQFKAYSANSGGERGIARTLLSQRPRSASGAAGQA